MQNCTIWFLIRLQAYLPFSTLSTGVDSVDRTALSKSLQWQDGCWMENLSLKSEFGSIICQCGIIVDYDFWWITESEKSNFEKLNTLSATLVNSEQCIVTLGHTDQNRDTNEDKHRCWHGGSILAAERSTSETLHWRCHNQKELSLLCLAGQPWLFSLGRCYAPSMLLV